MTRMFSAPGDQLAEEVRELIDLTFEVYRDFGFENIDLAFSTRPEQRVGEDELWDEAEAALQQVLEDQGLDYKLQPGEGAFYGPKIEFTLRDSIGRVWQCGTIQVDFSMPGRLDASYVGRGRLAPGAGHDPPCDPGFARALYRNPDRETTRVILPFLAGTRGRRFCSISRTASPSMYALQKKCLGIKASG